MFELSPQDEEKAVPMEGLKDPREWPNITRGLVSRGYKDEEIKGILGDMP
ncbi:hypothetical protein ES703_79317 [subsurface metagenome]